MTDLTCVDAAYPENIRGGPYDVVAFYIGGDTPHVWTKQELDARPERYRLPIYVRSNPPGPGASADVSDAMAQLTYLGAPKGILVAWDSETSQDAQYVRDVFTLVKAAGDVLMDYGSESTVYANHNPDGYYWSADWTGTPHKNPGSVETQYVSFSGYDESLAQSALPFWDTRRSRIPLPSSQPGGNMISGQLINEAFQVFPPGAFKDLWLYRDFMRPDFTAHVRVALHSASHGYTVQEYTISDATPGKIGFTFPDVDAISLRRTDGAVPIGYTIA
jgi:hypothetical protein